MEPWLQNLLGQFPLLAIVTVFYLSERQENKKLVEQNRTDYVRHEETILKLVESMGRCPIIGERVLSQTKPPNATN